MEGQPMDAPLDAVIAIDSDDDGQYAEVGRYSDGSIYLNAEDGVTEITLRLTRDQAVALMAHLGSQLAA
jgi:hypothetical protein